MKIAITSKDGKYINEHFGKAKEFYIYELDLDQMSLVEIRSADAYCQYNGDVNHEFEEEHFNKTFEVLHDCKILFTEKIGQTPKQTLLDRNITVVERNCAFDDILIKKYK